MCGAAWSPDVIGSRSSAARTIAAVASSSVISSGSARTVTPGTLAESVSWMSHPSSSPPSLRLP